jgi:UDP-N-acetylglucosamine 3-dehydrogenase
MTKVLLVGMGRWGANHLRNLHNLPVELFVAEMDSCRLEPARKLGVPESHLTTRYQDFLPRVDAALVVTPAPTHYPLAKEFLEAGKDVFVEKPVTLVASEALHLAELAKEGERILQVGHICRYDPAAQWLREAIQSGRFGRVQMLRGNISGFKRPRSDSGMMFADAIHFVDLFNHFLGRTPARVRAVVHDFLGRGLDDAALLSLEYEMDNGIAWATIEADCFQPGKVREVTVTGSELSARCDLNAARERIHIFANQHVQEGDEFKGVEGAAQLIETKVEEPLKAELQAFIDSVRTRKTPLADGWAGYDAVRVLEAALESAKIGRVVHF